MKIAAVVYEPGQSKALDDLFCDVALTLRKAGIPIAGTIQRNAATPANACANMVLEDLVSSRMFDISVPAPLKTESCSLDPAALEDAAGQVAATLGADTAVVIVNRFGKQEVLGCGMRSVIEQAVAEEIPVVTALCGTHMEEWDAFAGSEWTRLAFEREAILSWCRAHARTTQCPV